MKLEVYTPTSVAASKHSLILGAIVTKHTLSIFGVFQTLSSERNSDCHGSDGKI